MIPRGFLLLLCATSLRAQGFDGTWAGVADTKPDAGRPVGVRLTIEQRGDSARIAFTLPESRIVGLTIPSPYSDSTYATIRGGELRLEFTPDIGLGNISRLGPASDERIALTARLEGRDQLVGTVRITSYTSPIVLRRVQPDDREIRLTFMNPNDSLRLGATLVLPVVRRPPVVVFVTGSDPDARDAWRYEAGVLAGAGVASLLYDKRGVGESSGASHDLASWDDLAGDLSGAVNWLASRPDLVDTARIGVIGQSQGTWMIAKVAAKDPRVKYMVSIAGSGMSGAEQETYRTSALMRRDGFSDREIERAVDFQRRKFAVARTGLGWEALDSTMQRLRADSVRWFPGYGTGAAARSLAVLRLYGVLQFNYDPTRDLEHIRIPTLVIMGENDVVFPPKRTIELMEHALGRAGNRCLTSRIIPQASHGLLVTQAYQGRPFRRVISEEFLTLLTTWIPTATRCGTRK